MNSSRIGMVLGPEWRNPSALVRKAAKPFTNPRGFLQSAGRYYEEWRCRRSLVRAGLGEEVERVERKSRATGSFAPPYHDMWYLYDVIRRRKPRLVWEFGTGSTTHAIAAALHENAAEGAPGKAYAFDATPEWCEATRQWLPEHLAAHVEIRYTPARVDDWDGTPVFRHEGLPDLVPDFIYLDGPPLTREVRAAVDLLDMEDRFQPGTLIVVDGRIDNSRFLAQHFRREWRQSRYIGAFGCDHILRYYFELVE